MSGSQKIDIVLAKRVCVTQNTEHYIIMLLVSVCQYDLACQRLLSGIIACTTFRRLCMLVPPLDSSVSGQHMDSAHLGQALFPSSPPFHLSSLHLSVSPFLWELSNSFPLLSCCKWSPSQPPVFALGCVIEELSFINDYITNTNQTKELLFLLLTGTQEQRWSSEATVEVPTWKRSEGFRQILWSTRQTRRERVNRFNLHACIYS